MTAEQLRNSILQEAISGRLTQSDTSDWREITIGQLGTVVTGTTPSKQNKEYYGDDYPFYKPSDLDAGIYTVKASDGLSKVGYEHARQLPANSILVTCIGATIGKTGLIKREGSCNQQINAIIPDADCDSRFIYYLMISPDVQEVIKYKSYSTTLPILNKTQFSQLEVTLPPLAEQKRIVAKLEELLPIVDQYGKAQKELDELNAALPARLRQSILQEAISGRLVPQDPNEIAEDVKATEIEDEPFEIPNNWRWCLLGDLIDMVSGTSYKKGDVCTNGVRILRGGNIVNDELVLAEDDVFLPNEYENIEKNIRKDDIIIVASTGSQKVIGKPALIRQNYDRTQIGAFLRIIRAKDAKYVPYLWLVFKGLYYREHIRNLVKGTNINNIKEEYITALPIPLPPLAEQQRIVAKIEELFEQINKITK